MVSRHNLNLPSQIINKFWYKSIAFIVFLTVTDENIVIATWDETCQY